MVPLPVTDGVTMKVFILKVVVTVVVPISGGTLTVHSFPLLESQPDQETKVELTSGVAVNITVVPKGSI